MIKDFGIKNAASQEDVDFFNNLKEKLNSKNIEGSLYYGYPLYEQDKQKVTLRSILNCKYGIYVFFRRIEEKKSYQRYITDILMDSEKLSELYFSNTLIPIYVKIEEIEINEFVQKLDEEKYSPEITALFDQTFQKCFGLNHSDERVIKKQNSIGDIIKKRNNSINSYDEIQFKKLYEDEYSNLRIRGLAGSGKTILLVKKMAYMHFKMRSLKLVYVFYTKSLKQYIKKMFEDFYHDFDRFNDPDWNNVKILHSWGSANEEGFYSLCCQNCNIIPERYNKYTSDLEGVCFRLLENCDKSSLQMFDYIFMDEAQDFRINFFKLAKSSLKSTGKLIYAYDEIQTLDESEKKMPQKEEIFEENEVCGDVGLSRCYRTPMEILVVAHAIGLGIYRVNKFGKREFSTFISDKSLWADIGYKIKSGRLEEGEEVTLYRENIVNEKVSAMIDIRTTENLDDEFNVVIQEISNLIFNEDVLPEDILIIDLDSINLQNNYQQFRQKLYTYFEENNLYKNNERPFGTNLVNKQNALKFIVSNSVSYTTIFRAKGNEAPIVIILNSHKMGVLERYRRNRLFTAMTRAKTKVYLLGDNNMDAIISEFNQVKENNYMLTFTYPTQTELDFYRDKMLEESKKVQGLQNSIDFAKKLSKEQLIQLILEQTGQGSAEELIKYLQNEENEEN